MHVPLVANKSTPIGGQVQIDIGQVTINDDEFEELLKRGYHMIIYPVVGEERNVIQLALSQLPGSKQLKERVSNSPAIHQDGSNMGRHNIFEKE